jgi:hypothetical protein
MDAGKDATPPAYAGPEVDAGLSLKFKLVTLVCGTFLLDRGIKIVAKI